MKVTKATKRESQNSDMTILGGELWIKYSFIKTGNQQIISKVDKLRNILFIESATWPERVKWFPLGSRVGKEDRAGHILLLSS